MPLITTRIKSTHAEDNCPCIVAKSYTTCRKVVLLVELYHPLIEVQPDFQIYYVGKYDIQMPSCKLFKLNKDEPAIGAI